MHLPDISKNFLQEIQHPFISEKNISLFILRLDLLHPIWGGNKWFKLKYHIDEALTKGYQSVGSFGGPWSNHLAALAAFGHQNEISTIGKVRFQGDYRQYPTLVNAEQQGMKLLFLSNDEYLTDEKNATKINDTNTYWIPSGGHTTVGVKGCEEILRLPCLKNVLPEFSHIITPVGNGTTLAGISNSALHHQKIIGITAIKNGAYLMDEIQPFVTQSNIELWLDYHFGGFGKTNESLIDFKTFLLNELNLPTDKVYTAKMMYGIWDNIKNNFFKPGNKILAVHTGGLQGNGSNLY